MRRTATRRTQSTRIHGERRAQNARTHRAALGEKGQFLLVKEITVRVERIGDTQRESKQNTLLYTQARVKYVIRATAGKDRGVCQERVLYTGTR